jgi:tetratricopeptide (TPR) repeat protein
MSAEEPLSPEDQLLSRLLACDNALAAGTAHQGPPGDETPAEFRQRLEKDLACIQMLRQVLPYLGPGGAAAAPSALPLRRLGRFEIRRELGQGAFGMVFLASDPQLGREVALKVPRPEALLTPELRERFVREARAAAGLDHPNLVPVYEAGAEGLICYIASAYWPGITLTEWLRDRSEAVPLRQAAELVATLADAVGHAHERGVVHRDLKPSNVLLQRRPPPAAGARPAAAGPDGAFDFVPRITDFGLAKRTAEAPDQPGEEGGARTQSGAVLGTPNYMAPEQAGGKSKEIGPAADVYALGVILYELLTGRPPFRGETLLDTLEQVRSREPLPPGRLRPGLSRDLETICLKCLQKEPRKRYESAAALAEDLRRYLAGTPIRARPVRAWERGIKWARRKPALAALLALSALAPTALLAVVLGYGARLAGTNAQLVRANEDLKGALATAETERTRAEEKRRESNENWGWARSAVDDFATRVSQDPRLLAHDLEGLRKELLHSAAGYYQKFLKQRPEDPDLQLEYARDFERLGRLSRELGAKPEAVVAYQEAADLSRKLVREHPGVPLYPLLLSDVLTGLAIVYKDERQSGRAESALGEARDIRQQLALEHPTEPAYRSALAETHNNLAVLYEERARACRAAGDLRQAEADFRQAEADFRDARDVWVQLAQGYPGVEPFQISLPASHYNLGRLYEGTNQLDEAEKSFREACRLWRELAQGRPALPEYQDSLARGLRALGFVHGRANRPDKAVEAYDEARKILDLLAAGHPKVPSYQDNLAQAHYTLGQAYERLGRQARAEGAYGEAVKWCKGLVSAYPGVRDYQFALSRAQCGLGLVLCRPDRAKQAGTPLSEARVGLEKLTGGHPNETDYHLTLGNTYRGLGLIEGLQGNHPAARDWLDKSVQTLEAACKKGPGHEGARQALLTAYYLRVDTSARLGHYKDVLRDLARYLELDENGKNDLWRFFHAYALAQTGQHAPAMDEVNTLAGRQSVSAEDLFKLARVCSLCSAAVRRDARLAETEQSRRAEEYAARAVGLLKKAKTAGHFESAARLGEVRADKDLDPLRRRQDFQGLFPTTRPKDHPQDTP